MPVLSKCPLCRAVMPDVHGEARCPRCGEMVVPAIRKLCAGCGADVTRVKRVRDENGEYYCNDCWVARLAARGEEPGYVCSTCRRLFPADDVYQEQDGIICKSCFQQRNLDPNALLEVAAHAGDEAPVVFTPADLSDRGRTALPWVWIAVAAVVVTVLVIGITYLSR